MSYLTLRICSESVADRIAHYEHIHGKKEVEDFLDAVLAIQEHIDPSLLRPKLDWSKDELEVPLTRKRGEFDDLSGVAPYMMQTKKSKTVDVYQDIHISESGVISVLLDTLTGYRLLAEQVVDHLCQDYGMKLPIMDTLRITILRAIIYMELKLWSTQIIVE